MITRNKKKKQGKVGVFFLLIVLFFFIFLNVTVFHKRAMAERQVLELENKVKELEGRKEELIKKKDLISNNEYIEEVAREKMNLKKEGEKVVAFPEIQITKERVEEREEEKTFWQGLKEKIGL